MKHLTLALFAAAALCTAGCGNDPVVEPGPDAGCANPCGATCCAAGQACNATTQTCETACVPTTCAAAGRTCGKLANGCGAELDCGSCAAGQACSAQGKCECAPEADGAFCTRLGKQCGSVTANDNCGANRTVDCGTCTTGTCGDDNLCAGCQAETKDAFCARLQKTCGTVNAKDNCGTNRSYDCGTCGTGETCNANNTCDACVPETKAAFCARLDKQCGSVTALNNCGTSATFDCGTCGTGQSCNASGKCDACTPETATAFCTRLAKQCGSVTANDNCGTSKTYDCGTCTTGTCNANNQCACTPEDDATFCSRLQKNCGMVTANDNCGQSRTRDCGTCTGSDTCTMNKCTPCVPQCAGRACGPDLCGGDCGTCATGSTCNTGTGACRPNAPANDTCASPEPLVFTGPVATATGDTSNATNDVYGYSPTSACGGGTGTDVVYSFTLTAAKKVTLDVTPSRNGSVFEPIVYMRRAGCTDTSSAAQTGCTKAAAGQAATTSFPNVAADTYYVFVDGNNMTAGEFTLTVTLDNPMVAPSNDTCATATALTFTGNTATASGTTLLGTNDTNGTCGGNSSGPDVVYAFTLGAAKKVTAKVTPANATYKPSVYLRSACETASSEVACGTATALGATALTSAPNLGAGTYYVIVDGIPDSTIPGNNGASGDFTLELTLEDPPITLNDDCNTAQLLDLSSGSVTVQGSTVAANSSGGGATTTACKESTTPSNDVVYTFTLTAQTTIMAKLSTTFGAYSPMIYVRTGSCTSTSFSDEKMCAVSTSAGKTTVASASLAPGQYWLWVDGSYASSGDFTLEVSKVTTPANDTCSGAVALTRATPVAGYTISANSDYAGTGRMSAACDASYDSLSKPDVVYSYTPILSANFTVTVTPDSGFNPAVWVGTTCGVTSSCVGYSNTYSNETVTVFGNAGTTYYIVVDSAAYSSNTGTFTIKVE